MDYFYSCTNLFPALFVLLARATVASFPIACSSVHLLLEGLRAMMGKAQTVTLDRTGSLYPQFIVADVYNAMIAVL